MASFTVSKDDVTPFLTRLNDRLEASRPLMAALQTRLHGDLVDHFDDKESEPNKNGWPKQHFWAQISQATHPGDLTDTSAEVVIDDYRFAMRVKGGTIRAKEAKALTIPLDRRASGKRASTLEKELNVKLFRPGGKANPKNVLAANVDGKLVYFYALAKSVEHPKDPTALPPEAELFANLAEEIDFYFGDDGLA